MPKGEVTIFEPSLARPAEMVTPKMARRLERDLEKDTVFEESIEVEGNITGKDGERFSLTVKGNINAEDIKAWDIKAWDIKAKDIDAWNINTWNINARDISCYAVCFAYNNIECNSIKGRRQNAKHFCLDGKITAKKEVQKPKKETKQK